MRSSFKKIVYNRVGVHVFRLCCKYFNFSRLFCDHIGPYVIQMMDRVEACSAYETENVQSKCRKSNMFIVIFGRKIVLSKMSCHSDVLSPSIYTDSYEISWSFSASHISACTTRVVSIVKAQSPSSW